MNSTAAKKNTTSTSGTRILRRKEVESSKGEQGKPQPEIKILTQSHLQTHQRSNGRLARYRPIISATKRQRQGVGHEFKSSLGYSGRPYEHTHTHTQKKSSGPGVMAHAIKPSTQKAEAGRSVSSRPALSI